MVSAFPREGQPSCSSHSPTHPGRRPECGSRLDFPSPTPHAGVVHALRGRQYLAPTVCRDCLHLTVPFSITLASTLQGDTNPTSQGRKPANQPRRGRTSYTESSSNSSLSPWGWRLIWRNGQKDGPGLSSKYIRGASLGSFLGKGRHVPRLPFPHLQTGEKQTKSLKLLQTPKCQAWIQGPKLEGCKISKTIEAVGWGRKNTKCNASCSFAW